MKGTRRLLGLALTAVALAAGCGGNDDDDDAAATTPATTERPATPAPGGTIVFKRYLDPEHQHGVIVTINPDGTVEEQIIDPPDGASDDQPVVSADGTKIAFTRQAQTGQVWTAGIDGSRPRRLDPADIDGTRFTDERSDPAFSPDGSLIAFNRGWGEVDPEKDQIQFSEVYLMDARGRHPRRLTRITAGKPYSGDVGAASWSPDGKQVVVAHRTPVTGSDLHDLDVVTVPGGRARHLTPKSVRAEDPNWSPDGKTILFRTVPPGEDAPGGELYTISPDGSGMKQLTRSEDGTLMLSAAYSPDGNWIVFSKSVDGNEPDLYIMNADGSDVRRVTKSPLWDSRPTWGP
ncbi:MAG: TolB family protein [Gaiellaceae bacterium]